jgi:hypothetical protein
MYVNYSDSDCRSFLHKRFQSCGPTLEEIRDAIERQYGKEAVRKSERVVKELFRVVTMRGKPIYELR